MSPPAGDTTTGRNDPCPCGSGKKYKRCCMEKHAAGSRPAAPQRAKDAVPRLLHDAEAHTRAGRIGQAGASYERVLELDPRNVVALVQLGQLATRHGDPEAGLALFRKGVRMAPDQADVHVGLANALLRTGRADEALRSARRAVSLAPDASTPHRMESMCHERMHRLEDARASIERALRVAPDDPEGILVLARLDRLEGRPADAIPRLEALVEGPSDSVRTHALYEQGKVLEATGAYEASYDATKRAGAKRSIEADARGIDRGALPARLAAYRAAPSSLLSRFADLEFERRAPLFMIGFPRSGTTMVENVLNAHTRARTSDEEPMIDRLRRELLDGRGPGDVVEALDELDAERVLALRRAYWAHAEASLGTSLADVLFVDKMPMNTGDVPFINVLFPDARLIFMVRDPRDVCLSCFQQDFALSDWNVHLLDLEDTARAYADVVRTWLDVRDRLTLRWLEVRYEQVVGDLESAAREIVAFAGLEWEDGVLAFHEKARGRLIRTASYQAVKEPAHTRAIRRWERFAPQIAAVSEILEPARAAFGYD